MAKFRELALLLTSIATLSWAAHLRTNFSAQVPGQVDQTSDLGHGITLVLSHVPYSDSAQSSGKLNPPAGYYASLLQGGKVVYLSPTEQLGFLREQHPAGRPGAKDPDLLGNGHPQLLLRGLNSATYDHQNLYLFDLTPDGGPPKLIFSQDIEGARVVDLDGDGRSEILAVDPEVGSAKDHPTFVYQVDSSGLRISPELMARLPGPRKAEIDQVIAAVREANTTYEETYFSLAPYTELRQVINQLFYSGRGKEVQPILDAIWMWSDHSPRSVYRRFLEVQRHDMEASKLWPTVRSLNGFEQGWRDYSPHCEM